MKPYNFFYVAVNSSSRILILIDKSYATVGIVQTLFYGPL